MIQTSSISKSLLFPEVAYFQNILMERSVTIDVCENYQKRSFRNKYKLLGANGCLLMSVPLRRGKNEQTNIKDVLIAYDEDWIHQHLLTIKSCYGKAAYFEHYYLTVEKLILSRFKYLYDLNSEALLCVFKLLKVEIKLLESTNFIKEPSLIPINVKSYPQVFENKFGFTSGLSIIDLLFNMGPESINYI